MVCSRRWVEDPQIQAFQSSKGVEGFACQMWGHLYVFRISGVQKAKPFIISDPKKGPEGSISSLCSCEDPFSLRH